MAAAQSAVARLAAINPDVLIIAYLRCCWSGSFFRRRAPRPWKRPARRNLAHLAAGHPVAGSHLAQLRTNPAAAFDRDRATRMKRAARRRVDRARHLPLHGSEPPAGFPPRTRARPPAESRPPVPLTHVAHPHT